MFILRALQVGLKLSDLDFLETGEVIDILIERGNDDFNYALLPEEGESPF